MTIGEKIKLARREKGYSQNQLADLLGCSRSAIACYETERRIPDFKDLQRIASMLGVSVEYFADMHPNNELTDFILRATALFSNIDIPVADKEKVFNELMKIYIRYK